MVQRVTRRIKLIRPSSLRFDVETLVWQISFWIWGHLCKGRIFILVVFMYLWLLTYQG